MRSDDIEAALSRAEALFDRGDQRAALELLEGLLRKVKPDRAPEVLPVARALAARADPEYADGYGRLVRGLEQSVAFLERFGPPPSRASVWAGRRRTAAMVGLCIVLPGLVIAATGDTTLGIVWTEIGLFASPVAFVVHGERWGAPVWLCGVAGLYVLGSSVLLLLMAVFVASVTGVIALGTLVAALAGAAALAGCIPYGQSGSLRTLVAFEAIAVVGIAGALVLVSSDSENLHHVVGGATGTTTTVSDWSGLTTFWGTAAVMIVIGGGVALKRSSQAPAPSRS